MPEATLRNGTGGLAAPAGLAEYAALLDHHPVYAAELETEQVVFACAVGKAALAEIVGPVHISFRYIPYSSTAVRYRVMHFRGSN